MTNIENSSTPEKRESSHFIMASTPTMREKIKSISKCLMNILKLKRMFKCTKKNRGQQKNDI